MAEKPNGPASDRHIGWIEAADEKEAEAQAHPGTVPASNDALLTAMPIPLLWKDIEGRHLGCSGSFSALTGLTASGIRGRTAREIWPAGYAGFLLEKDAALIANPGNQVFEYEIRDKHGDIRPARFNQSVWRDGGGRAAGILCAVQDISDAAGCRRSLEESEQRFRLLTDFTDSWEYWIGPDSRLRYVSQSCKNHTGYSPEEFLAQEDLLRNMIHPDDREGVMAHILHETDGPAVETMTFRIVDRSGRVRWISHSCRPVHDEGHAFLGRRASNREITDQKAAEAQRDDLTENLRSTSMLLNTILDAIPDVIGVQDADHRIVRYNKAGYAFLGKEPSEVHGRKCHELIGNRSPCAVCATSEVYQTRRAARVEKYVAEFDKWLDVRAYPILDDKGEISQVIEHLRDVSREKHAEKELRDAHETLITILNSIDAHIYVADMDTYGILFLNKKMMDDFTSEYVGKKCHEVFRKQPVPCDHCPNPFLLDEDRNPTGVYTWQCVNPITQRWYINFDRAIQWVDGRIVRIQIATDITEARKNEEARMRMEQQLQQAQKFEAIGTLAGGIAHDFNNLLMGIQGRASLIAVDLDPSHPYQEHLGAIDEYIRSATNLTRQILGFARGGKYEVRPIDINALVRESATLFGRTRKEIRIHTRFQEPPPVVSADPRQIEQVLLNLYVNAWQAMPHGGELFLETGIAVLDEACCRPSQATPGRYARISVADTGVGMDASTLQRIFDPFFTTKEKGRGTGLGLASAYGIIKNHAGIIAACSDVGRGTTFTIHLPASRQKVQRENAPEARLIRGSETVLLVDDEALIIEVGRAMLEKLGYRVLVAQGGDKAVETVSEKGERIDLVLLDMVMPGLDGGATFDIIRSIRPDLPVILCSGYSIRGRAADILQRGCEGFIQKPFTIFELSEQVRKALDRAGEPGRA